MASLALITGAPTCAPTIPAANNENDRPLSKCWTQDPRAVAILSTCRADPPEGEWHRQQYARTRDEWWIYTGPRADTLAAIREEYGDRAYGAHVVDQDDEPKYQAFRAWCSSPSVTDAIDASLAWEAEA